jgi:trehalose-6-phosphatase
MEHSPAGRPRTSDATAPSTLSRRSGAIRAAYTSLVNSLAGVQGVELEHKGYTLVVHYRRIGASATPGSRSHRAGARLPATLRMMPGKLGVNVVHKNAPTNATAVLQLRDELGVDTALYVGDATSDESVFELVNREDSSQSRWAAPTRRTRRTT